MDTIHVWEYQKTKLEETKTLAGRDLSKPKRAILQALGTFNLLTAEQLTRYLYSSTSHAYVQSNLRELVREGYLDTLIPPKQTRYGSTPFVYYLNTRGRNYLVDAGLLTPSRFRPSEERRRRGGPILHTLAVNEVLLLVHLLERLEIGIGLTRFVTERELNREPLRVVLPENNIVSLSPDLWLDVRVGKIHYCLCIEVNLTPIEQRRWRQKVRSYVYCTPAYKERFGTEAIVVAVLVASPLDFPRRRTDSRLTLEEVLERESEKKRQEKRLQDLLHWTEMELSALNVLSEEADLFRMSSVSPDFLTPQKLFLDPRFYMPTVPAPVALIPDEEVSFG